MLIPAHGGYRNLKSYQTATLVYDLTVRFCEQYVREHRMRDQMVQAARSGRQNIAEGSQASGTSKKTEIKLVSVARASLEELLLDYEDFLRQKGLQRWGKWCQRKMVSGTFLYDDSRKSLLHACIRKAPPSAIARPRARPLMFFNTSIFGA